MANVLSGPIKKWAEDLALALQVYIEDQGISSRTHLAHQLGLPERSFRFICAGERVFPKGIEFYAEIFHQLGIPEADPGKIPVWEYYNEAKSMKVTKPLAWREIDWQKWLKSKKPSTTTETEDEEEQLVHEDTKNASGSSVITLTEIDFSQTREREKQFAQRLAEKLQQWMDAHGISTLASFAQSLGVTRRWLSGIMNDEVIGLDIEKYAQIYRITHIDEAAPWNIPNGMKKIPSGGFARVIRPTWSRERYKEWERQQDGDSFNELPPPILPPPPAPEVVFVQTQTPVNEPKTTEVQSLPIETPPDQMVHLRLEVLAETLKLSFLELARQGSSSSPEFVQEQLLESLPDRLDLLVQFAQRAESMLDRLLGLADGSKPGVAGTHLETASTQALMQELKKRLIASKSATLTARDNLSESIRRLAGELFPYLDAYAQATNEKREEVLSSMKEFR